MRTVLTDSEFNAISHLTSKTKMDGSFDITFDDEHDYFEDFEDGCELTLEDGLEMLYEGIAYPCEHEGLTKEEGTLIADVMIEFGIADQEWKDWFIETEQV